MCLKAHWTRICAPATNIPRSSHSLTVIKNRAFIFGGEIQPRQPVDNSMHVLTLPSIGTAETNYEVIPARAESAGEVPMARVGHTAATVGSRIYIFGGRGGKDMKPLEEQGRVWVFDTERARWSSLDPLPGSAFPAARSYHSSTGVADDNDDGTVFIHAGCPASGRLGDLWAFNIRSRNWIQLPDAPEPARGGTSIAFACDRLWRFGGFDGKNELGGQIDHLALSPSVLSGTLEGPNLSTLTGKWESVYFAEDSLTSPSYPGARSVAGLHHVTTARGLNYLVTLLGEKNPSSQGHEGAGKFWSDVWALRLGTTATIEVDPKSSGNMMDKLDWKQVDVNTPEGATDNERMTEDKPGARGWISSAIVRRSDKCSVMIWGGLNEQNEREGDGWLLTIE